MSIENAWVSYIYFHNFSLSSVFQGIPKKYALFIRITFGHFVRIPVRMWMCASDSLSDCAYICATCMRRNTRNAHGENAQIDA